MFRFWECSASSRIPPYARSGCLSREVADPMGAEGKVEMETAALKGSVHKTTTNLETCISARDSSSA